MPTTPPAPHLTRSVRAQLAAAVGVVAVGGTLLAVMGARHPERALTLALMLTGLCLVGLCSALVSVRAHATALERIARSIAALGDAQSLLVPDHTAPPTYSELTPLFDALVGARQSLTRQIRRERMETQRAHAIVRASSLSVLTLDCGGRILSANPAAALLLARSEPTLVGALLSDVLDATTLRISTSGVGTISFGSSDEVQHFCSRIRVPGVRQFSADVTVVPLQFDRQRGWAVQIADRTEHERFLAALDEVRQTAHQVTGAQSAFLSRVNHAARGPLTAIIGGAGVMHRSKLSQLSERDAATLLKVQSSGEQLQALIRDLLDLSRIEAGTIELTHEAVDVSAMVRALVPELQSTVADRPVALQCDLPVSAAMVSIDAARLRQILTSLVSNALKFTARGSVCVTVHVDAATGRASAVAVRDSGIGIPLDRQARIFDAFEQGCRDTSNRYGGAGIGLALARAVAHRMGCSLSVESMPGAGSTFTLSFQNAEGETGRRPVLTAASPSLHQLA